MTQVVARLPEELLESVDHLVEEGLVTSRSEAVRIGLEALVDRHRRDEVGAAIVASYRARPQDEFEVGWADASTARMIAEEPW